LKARVDLDWRDRDFRLTLRLPENFEKVFAKFFGRLSGGHHFADDGQRDFAVGLNLNDSPQRLVDA
jgi:hypothetical protein